MRDSPPLVVLILGGAAERQACPPPASPLAQAKTPRLDGLAREGRVFSVQLCENERDPFTAAPLLAILGLDPAAVETARASYLGRLAGESLAAEECFVSADFLALFRDVVADVEPGPMRPAEIAALLGSARDAVQRAGFRLVAGRGPHHIAVAPRASVDRDVPAPEVLLGHRLDAFEPRVEQHAFAHRLLRQALDGHEINEVRRDLGGNGADMVWLWGPGRAADIAAEWDAPVAALGRDPLWQGVCAAAGVPLRAPKASTSTQLVRGLTQALRANRIVFVYARRGVRDALLRDLGLRAAGIADLDEELVGPVADLVARRKGRLLVIPDAARDTESGRPLADPVPALLWGAGVQALSRRAFTEHGAAAAGDPLAPGHGLLQYVRSL